MSPPLSVEVGFVIKLVQFPETRVSARSMIRN